MYEYNINADSPWPVNITGPKYNTIYNFDPATNQPFTSYNDAERFAQEEIDRIKNPPRYEIWYHIDATGGDGKNPAGIRNDGTDALNITITARETEDPESPVRGINDDFRMEIRTSDGYVYDVLLVSFVNGVGSLTYTDDAPKGNTLTVSIPEGLVVQINDDGTVNVPPFAEKKQVYSVYLAGETQFIVYRVI